MARREVRRKAAPLCAGRNSTVQAFGGGAGTAVSGVPEVAARTTAEITTGELQRAGGREAEVVAGPIPGGGALFPVTPCGVSARWRRFCAFDRSGRNSLSLLLRPAVGDGCSPAPATHEGTFGVGSDCSEGPTACSLREAPLSLPGSLGRRRLRVVVVSISSKSEAGGKGTFCGWRTRTATLIQQAAHLRYLWGLSRAHWQHQGCRSKASAE